jgi:hypothetical protein
MRLVGPGRPAAARLRWWPFRPAAAVRRRRRIAHWVSGIHADSARASRPATGPASARRASSTDLGGSRPTAGASGSVVRNRKVRVWAGRWPPPPGVAGRRIALEALRFRAMKCQPRRVKVRGGSSRHGEAKAKNLRPIRYSRRVIPVGTRAKSCSLATRPMTLCRAARIVSRFLSPPSYLLAIYCGTGVA